MAHDDILTGASGAILTVTLNRPEKLNALTPEMHAGLEAVFDRFAADEALRVCVVRGAGGRAFCAGSDLTRVAGGPAYPRTGYGGLAERFDLAKPVIAAVEGICMGGGFELALSCDIIVASESAVFGLPEPRVGVIAVGGGIHRLVRLAGKRAMGPLLTGRRIAAAEALAMGCVNEVVAPGELDAAVARWCDDILACAPLAVGLTKALAQWSLDQPSLAEAIAGQAAHPLFAPWLASADAKEGPRAFAEKRKPEWTGR